MRQLRSSTKIDTARLDGLSRAVPSAEEAPTLAMSDLDPYLAWLDVPVDARPVNHYRLLGLREKEASVDAIESAADRVQRHVKQYSSGEHSGAASKILAEIKDARDCLLDPQRKRAYDAQLGDRAKFETAIKPPPPVPGRPIAEQKIAAAPPPGGSLPTSASSDTAIRSAPPVPGKSAMAPASGGPVLPPPPSLGRPSLPQPAGAPGTPAQGTAAQPPATSAPGTSAPPIAQAPPAPVAAPPPPAMPPVSPATNVTPIAKAVGEQPAAQSEAGQGSPSWAPEGRTGKVGKAVTAVTETGKSRPQKTRKAQMLRKKTRQQSEFMVASLVLGALAIAAGLILLIILALSS